MAGSWLLVSTIRSSYLGVSNLGATAIWPVLPWLVAVRTSGGRPADVRGGIQEVAEANFGRAPFGSTVAGVTADEKHC